MSRRGLPDVGPQVKLVWCGHWTQVEWKSTLYVKPKGSWAGTNVSLSCPSHALNIHMYLHDVTSGDLAHMKSLGM